MNLNDDIRRVLGNSGEPMTGREVCNAMGCETKDERDEVYKRLAAMVSSGTGVERLDDGRYMLTPGWKPKRGGRPPKWTRLLEAAAAQKEPAAPAAGSAPAAEAAQEREAAPVAAPIKGGLTACSAESERLTKLLNQLTPHDDGITTGSVVLPRETIATLVDALLQRAGLDRDNLRALYLAAAAIEGGTA